MNTITNTPTMSEEVARVLVEFDQELGRGLSAREARAVKEAEAALAYYKAQRKASKQAA